MAGYFHNMLMWNGLDPVLLRYRSRDCTQDEAKTPISGPMTEGSVNYVRCTDRTP
jgi:hypothetical protein